MVGKYFLSKCHIVKKKPAQQMQKFKATLEIIDINPFVFVPEKILANIFEQAGKDKGYIPICGTINGKAYIQTLLRFRGEWRLYINMAMLKDSPKRIGEEIEVTIRYDPVERTLTPHPELVKAINENELAKSVFDTLAPSKQKEMIRYIAVLKSEKSITIGIEKIIGFLTGKNKFAGREKP